MFVSLVGCFRFKVEFFRGSLQSIEKLKYCFLKKFKSSFLPVLTSSKYREGVTNIWNAGRPVTDFEMYTKVITHSVLTENLQTCIFDPMREYDPHKPVCGAIDKSAEGIFQMCVCACVYVCV